MYWECDEAVHYESFHFPLTDPHNLGQKFGAGKSPPKSADPTKLQHWWDDLIEHYSTCYLTQPMDRMPAVSGIANLFQNLTGGKYLGGLWLDDLPAGLLWDRQWSLCTTYRDACVKYKAPSWSWVSFNDAVSYRMKPGKFIGTQEVLEPMIEIVDAGVKQVGINPFGLLESGSLKVRGKMKIGAIYAWPEEKGCSELQEKWKRSLFMRGRFNRQEKDSGIPTRPA